MQHFQQNALASGNWSFPIFSVTCIRETECCPNNETVFETLREYRGDGEALVFARSATAGSQRFPVHWGGDSSSTFESMAESLRGGLSLTTCGFGFWSHDIGGFEGNPPPAVYKRWIQFGLMSSHSRLHGSSSYRVPWLVDEESCDVLRALLLN